MKFKYHIVLLLALCFCLEMKSQTIAVKSNLLYDLTSSINAGIELGLAPKWTLDVTGQFNAWDLSHNRRWKHWAVQPEVRYWLCDRFGAHFFGFHLHGGQYNIGGIDGKVKFLGTDARKLKDARYQGWFVGTGIAYGYAWILGRHWNLEATVGVGYLYLKSDKYPCANCGRKQEGIKKHYFGPTQAAINLIYQF